MKKRVKFYNYSGDCSGSRTYAWIKPFGPYPVGKHGEGWGGFGSIRVEPILVDIWSKVGYAWEEYIETHEEEEYV